MGEEWRQVTPIAAGALEPVDHPLLDPSARPAMMPEVDAANSTSAVPTSPARAVAADDDRPALDAFEAVLRYLPEGAAVLDAELSIRWSNAHFQTLCGRNDVVGLPFLSVFGAPEDVTAEGDPPASAFVADHPVRTRIRVGDRRHFDVLSTKIARAAEGPSFLLATVRDVSEEVHERQKLTAILSAGSELSQISADELQQLSVQDRIELLKQKIIQFTKDVFQYETIEIRMLDKATKELVPLLNVGMTPEAATRKLFAEKQGNGVTGFVAAGGGSYLCEDASQDPLYLPGAANARSSLTVPLILHDEIFGTFNVESDRIGAFTRQDLKFLEMFGREVAIAINTLELLAVEQVTAAAQSAGLILREVARPVDEILNDTTWILDRYIGHDPEVCERLQKVQKHTRSIKVLIQKVGEAMTPVTPHAAVPARTFHPLLRSKRILVVDNDPSVRDHAHAALGQIGCEVETAHNGAEALLMARSFHYDAVLVDIRLPDMNGYECFVQLRNINEHLPVILMTGFGYDPGHSIVKARQAGLKSALYKPFRLDQLLTELERAIAPAPEGASKPPAP
jgi:CheY-like chemotaxis protein